MDSYGSWNSHDNQDEEHFHFSLPCNPEDIIYPGSDAEETAEEVQQKRRRYEEQAERYRDGHLPVLQSASLRGPLSKETEWVNPWRYRPRRKLEEDWWKPGSEEMMFTRGNVMKRAADHGLGYLTPTEALAWCKASAQAEVNAVNGLDIQGDILMSVEKDEQLDPEDATDEKPGQVHVKLHSDRTYVSGQQDISMVNHYNDTPYASNPLESTMRGKKRPLNTQWLKGSYVSKRARWDGPAVSTPTPLPDTIGGREREHRRAFSNAETPMLAQTHPAPRMLDSFADIQKGRAQAPDNLGADTTAKSLQNSQLQFLSEMESSNERAAFKSASQSFQQEEDINVLYTDPPKLPAISASPRQSGQRSQRGSSYGKDQSFSGLEWDDLDAVAFHQPNSSATPANLRQGIVAGTFNSSTSNKPPTGANTRFERGKDDSFITVVESSSEGLGEFRFRKKRTSKDLNPRKQNIGMANRTENDSKPNSRMILSDQAKFDAQNPPYQSAIVQIDFTKKISPETTRPSNVEESSSPMSEKSDTSWDMVEDPSLNSSIHHDAVETVSGEPASSHGIHSQEDSISSLASETRRLPQPSSLRSNVPLKSLHPTTFPELPYLQHISQKLPLHTNRVEVARNPNDFSTQSYNTTPTRSRRSPEKSQGLLSLKLVPTQDASRMDGETESPKDEQGDMMEDIQKALSQNCRSMTSEDCSQNSQDQEGPELQNEVGAIVESQFFSSGTPASDGRRSPIQSPPKDNAKEEIGRNVAKSPIPHKTLLASPGGEKCSSSLRNAQTGENEDCSTASANLQDKNCSNEPISADHVTVEADDRPSKPIETKSQTSWRGCEPQSPWAVEFHEPLPSVHRILKGNENKSLTMVGCNQGSPTRSDSHVQDEGDPDWQHVGRPQTPLYSEITPFKNFISLEPAPIARETQLEESVDLSNTQQLVHAATNNPWSSNLKTPALGKFKKRVSFGALPSEAKDESQSKLFECSITSKQIPQSPPPPQGFGRFNDEQSFNDGVKAARKFENHFLAAKQFKRILSENHGSQLNSSPAFSAQAEAFIAADQETSTEEQLSSNYKTPLRHVQLGTKDSARGAWNHHVIEDSLLTKSVSAGPRGRDNGAGYALANFDMDAALDEVGDFLEDWSVDAELKKAKELSASKHNESAGLKRRRLFGIVQ